MGCKTRVSKPTVSAKLLPLIHNFPKLDGCWASPTTETFCPKAVSSTVAVTPHPTPQYGQVVCVVVIIFSVELCSSITGILFISASLLYLWQILKITPSFLEGVSGRFYPAFFNAKSLPNNNLFRIEEIGV